MELHELNQMFDRLAPTPEQEQNGLNRLLQTERKVRPMKKLKKLTAAGVAAALMAVTCAAAVVTGVDQKILGYFNIAPEQEPLMAPTAVRVEKSHTYGNGWTVDIRQAISDRYSMAVLFDVTAPEGTSMDWEKSGIRVQSHPSTSSPSWGVGSSDYQLADEDPEDNRASYLLFLHYDNQEAYDILGSVWELTPEYFWYIEQDGTDREVPLEGWTCTVRLSEQDPGLLYEVGKPISLIGCETELYQAYLSPISFFFRLRNIPDALWETGSDLGDELRSNVFLHTDSGEVIGMTLTMGGLTNPDPYDFSKEYGLYQYDLEQVIDPAEIVSVTICGQVFALK